MEIDAALSVRLLRDSQLSQIILQFPRQSATDKAFDRAHGVTIHKRTPEIWVISPTLDFRFVCTTADSEPMCPSSRLYKGGLAKIVACPTGKCDPSKAWVQPVAFAFVCISRHLRELSWYHRRSSESFRYVERNIQAAAIRPSTGLFASAILERDAAYAVLANVSAIQQLLGVDLLRNETLHVRNTEDVVDCETLPNYYHSAMYSTWYSPLGAV
jgi:hypothetical protein